MAQLTPQQMAILARLAGETNATISAHNQSINEGRSMAIDRITPEQLRASMRVDPFPTSRVQRDPPRQNIPPSKNPPKPHPVSDDAGIADVMPDMGAPLIPMPKEPVVPSEEELPDFEKETSKPVNPQHELMVLSLLETITNNMNQMSKNMVVMSEILREMRSGFVTLTPDEGGADELGGPFGPIGPEVSGEESADTSTENA